MHLNNDYLYPIYYLRKNAPGFLTGCMLQLLYTGPDDKKSTTCRTWWQEKYDM